MKYHADKIQKELGLPFDFHSFRHTHATMLIENDTNIKKIQACLGHSRISTTLDTYSHITKKMSTETVDIFEKMMNHDA
ncbi:tyrosine-type recombinase/integrase [Levilactobacillus huananensis]|uniref:tyrosine-type recombinase/integrase n=1 Tax=Levilactobacillus huananensis TaxID=2486019 RepID=UPI000F7874C7